MEEKAQVMLCSRGEWGRFPSPETHLFEVKVDGIRCLAAKRGETVNLRGRSGEDYTRAFPEVVAALQRLPGSFILDGELCSEGGWSFGRIAGRVHLRDPFKITLRARTDPAILWVFDILELEGLSLAGLPLAARKEVLGNLSLPPGIRLLSPSPLQPLVEAAEAGAIEGLVAKRKDSPYEFRRSPHWVKFRPKEGADYPIVGYETSDKPDRPFRSLILQGKEGEFQAASGLSREDLRALWEAFQGKEVARSVRAGSREKRYFASPIGEAEIVMTSAPDIPVRFPRVVRWKLDR